MQNFSRCNLRAVAVDSPGRLASSTSTDQGYNAQQLHRTLRAADLRTDSSEEHGVLALEKSSILGNFGQSPLFGLGELPWNILRWFPAPLARSIFVCTASSACYFL